MKKDNPFDLSNPFFQANMWSISHWLSILSLLLLFMLSWLPKRWVQQIGSAIGWLSFYFPWSRQRIIDTNLKLCFPDWNTQQRTTLRQKNSIMMGQQTLETPLCWFRPKMMQRHGMIIGLHHAKAIANRGIIFLGIHLSNLEWVACTIGQYIELHTIYRPLKNPWYNWFCQHGRQRYVKLIHRNNMKQAWKVLQNHGIIWYTADQDCGSKNALFSPFFDHPAATLTTICSLAKRTQAIVIPVWQYYDKNHNLIGEIGKPWPNFPTEDPQADLNRINCWYEQLIRKYPEQYLWMHRRFKTRPAGEKSVY